MSVPVWLIILSDQLSVLALVGRYPTNKLMDRGPILRREAPKGPPLFPKNLHLMILYGISHRFQWLSHSQGQVTHVLLTRAPLY